MMERRRARSNDRQTALALLLDACRERAAAATLVVADERGLLVAGSGDGDLAAAAAYAGLGDSRIHPLEVAGYPLHVSAVGGDPAHLATELAHAATGTQRILQPDSR